MAIRKGIFQWRSQPSSEDRFFIPASGHGAYWKGVKFENQRDHRVIAPALHLNSYMVLDVRDNARLFGPASSDECRLFIHRMAALDVLRALGTERVADAALRVANGSAKAPTLNG